MTIEEQQKQLDFAISLYKNSTDIEGCILAVELIYQVLSKKEILTYNYLGSVGCKYKDVVAFLKNNNLKIGDYNYIMEGLSRGKLKVILEDKRYITLNTNYKEDAD